MCVAGPFGRTRYQCLQHWPSDEILVEVPVFALANSRFTGSVNSARFMGSVNSARFTGLCNFARFMGPFNFAQFVAPVNFAQFMGPFNFAQFMGPFNFAQFMGPFNFAQFMGGGNSEPFMEAGNFGEFTELGNFAKLRWAWIAGEASRRQTDRGGLPQADTVRLRAWALQPTEAGIGARGHSNPRRPGRSQPLGAGAGCFCQRSLVHVIRAVGNVCCSRFLLCRFSEARSHN